METKLNKYQSETEELHQAWSQIGPNFACSIEPSTLANSLASFDRLFSVLPNIKPGLKIIELGCGSGIFARKLLADYGNFISELWLVDISEPMLDLAKKRFSDLSNEQQIKIEFLALSIEHLENVPSGYFDFAVSNYCFHLVPNFINAFSEAKRVLKSKGHLLISTLAEAAQSERFSIGLEVTRELGYLNSSAKKFEMFKFGTKKTLREEGERAGFYFIHGQEHFDIAELKENFADSNFEFFQSFLNRKLSDEEEKNFKKLLQNRMNENFASSKIVRTKGINCLFQKQ